MADDLAGCRLASLLLELYSQQWPVRFGAILLPAQTIARIRESGTCLEHVELPACPQCLLPDSLIRSLRSSQTSEHR